MPECRTCSASFLRGSESPRKGLWLACQERPCPFPRSPRVALPRSAAPWEGAEVDSVLPHREWQWPSAARGCT
eukprot:2547715-Pleurochrysis_carterae.AAC.1